MSAFKKLIWRVEAFAYDVVCLFLKPFSFETISSFGGWLLRKIGPRSSKQKIVLKGLSLAFPDLSSDELKAL